jgi:predicted nucleic acid-binding protein
MKKILVDTSVIIDYLRRPDKKNSLFFKTFTREKNKSYISLTTITELWAEKNMAKPKSRKKVEQILKKSVILIPNVKTAKHAGEIIRHTKYQISYQDAQIASLALENNLIVLSLDKKYFKKINNLKLLT